ASVLVFFSSRRRHTRFSRDWSSDVCSSDLLYVAGWIDVAEMYSLLECFLGASRMRPQASRSRSACCDRAYRLDEGSWHWDCLWSSGPDEWSAGCVQQHL